MTQPKPLKWRRILAAFLDGRSWHALEAGPALRTTCLHSDVSGLEARGLKFDHTPVNVAGFDGIVTRVIRYRLRPESYALARRLLGLPAGPRPAASLSAEAEAYRRASGRG